MAERCERGMTEIEEATEGKEACMHGKSDLRVTP